MLVCRLGYVAFVVAAATTVFAAEVKEPSAADKQFVADTASAGTLETRLGLYASTNAADTDVKHFAETMVNDHRQANDELQTIASEKSIEIPKSLRDGDQKVLDRLEKLTGVEFDKAYMVQMIEDHKNTIAAFEKEVREGTEVLVKGFAEKTLPALREHLQMAETIVAKLK
jgi:putative membrane protein